jgi:FKBP-type peptidyl-prolyl cis-trans isomerase
MEYNLNGKGSNTYLAGQMRCLFLLLVGLLVHVHLLAQSFNTGEGFNLIPNNTFYKAHSFSVGESPSWGDFIRMKLDKYEPDGRLLFSTSMLNMHEGVEMELRKDGWEGDITDVFLLLHPGDSATVYVPVWVADKDSTQITADNYYRYEIKLLEFTRKSDYEQQKSDRLAMLRTKELALFDSISAHYIEKNITRLPSGVTIIKTLAARGKTLKKGDVASVHYKLKTIRDDRVLDNSYNRGKPFRFLVGEGQVIKGWDEAFLYLKLGEKAILLVPSWMAYGERGAGEDISPDTPLIFEVEIANEP